MANERAQDILLSSIFSMILGIVIALWASVFDHLFLENASREFLFMLWILYSAGIIGIGYILWAFAKKLGSP